MLREHVHECREWDWWYWKAEESSSRSLTTPTRATPVVNWQRMAIRSNCSSLAPWKLHTDSIHHQRDSTGISQVWAIASRVFIHSSVCLSFALLCEVYTEWDGVLHRCLAHTGHSSPGMFCAIEVGSLSQPVVALLHIFYHMCSRITWKRKTLTSISSARQLNALTEWGWCWKHQAQWSFAATRGSVICKELWALRTLGCKHRLIVLGPHPWHCQKPSTPFNYIIIHLEREL